MAGVDGLVDQAIQLAQVSGMSFSEALTGLRAATDLSEASVERARAVQAESELKAANERLARVDELFNGGPDTPCRTTYRDNGYEGVFAAVVDCVEVPMEDLRAALADPEGGA